MKKRAPAVVLVLTRSALRPLFCCLIIFLFLSTASLSAQERPLDTAHAAGWVVIPVSEYRELRAKVYPIEREPEPPPVDATLTRVDYDLQVAGDVAAGRATLTVDVLKDGWVRVPVPAGLLVREARLDGKLLSLTSAAAKDKDIKHLAALLSHSGRSVLVLTVDVPVTAAPGEETISLPSTDSGVTRAAIELPRQGISLRIGGGLLTEKSETDNATRLLAYGKGNEPLTFTWHKKIEEHRVDLPLRSRGTLTQLVSLSEDSTSICAEVDLDVVQGTAREARIRIPENVTVNQVSGAMVADWEMANRELAVTFLEPVAHAARFVITGETRLVSDGILDIPLLRLLNTEREEGGVAVEVLGAGEIKGQEAKGLEEADATDLGQMVASRQSPALIAFRARSGVAGATRSLSVTVARYDQQAVLLTADGKQLVRARYAVRNNQRNFVKITLPAGATVWSAALDGKPIRPGQSSDGSLLLELEKSRGDDAPAFPVEILYLAKAPPLADKSRAKLTLPALDLPVSRTGLLLYYPPQFRITAEPGVFRTQDYLNPVSTALAPSADDAAQAAYGSTQGTLADAGTGVGGIGNGATRAANEKKDSTQALLDSFRAKSAGGKVKGILPVNVSFPAFGPSLFLVSELTSESQAPAAEFSLQREKKGATR
jgi:hypothetical protein